MKSEVYCEAAQKLKEVVKLLKGDDMGLDGAVDNLACKIRGVAETDVDIPFQAAGLAWRRAPLREALCAGGHRYHNWDPPAFTREAAYGWRLPTPAELKRLYEEDPTCEVFEPIGRLTSKGVEGLGHIVALWTCDNDTRDFAIEATVTETFGLSCHPAFKSGYKATWLVHAV